MECAPSSSSTSSTYVDLIHACAASSVYFHPTGWCCSGISCSDCPVQVRFELILAYRVTHRAILAYHNAGLIDISEYLI